MMLSHLFQMSLHQHLKTKLLHKMHQEKTQTISAILRDEEEATLAAAANAPFQAARGKTPKQSLSSSTTFDYRDKAWRDRSHSLLEARVQDYGVKFERLFTASEEQDTVKELQ
jgi:hypothetical protein